MDFVRATVAAGEASQDSGAKNSEISFGFIVLTHFTLHFLTAALLDGIFSHLWNLLLKNSFLVSF